MKWNAYLIWQDKKAKKIQNFTIASTSWPPKDHYKVYNIRHFGVLLPLHCIFSLFLDNCSQNKVLLTSPVLFSAWPLFRTPPESSLNWAQNGDRDEKWSLASFCASLCLYGSHKWCMTCVHRTDFCSRTTVNNCG